MKQNEMKQDENQPADQDVAFPRRVVTPACLMESEAHIRKLVELTYIDPWSGGTHF